MKSLERLRRLEGADVRPLHRLHLRWSDGSAAEIDFRPFLDRRAFRALRDVREFANVRVGDWGHSLEWPSGVEIGADTLWLETLSALGRKDTRTFLEWRTKHGLSLSDAATALGLSRRMVAYYASGEKPVPKHILLACLGWEITSDPSHTEPTIEEEVRELIPA